MLRRISRWLLLCTVVLASCGSPSAALPTIPAGGEATPAATNTTGDQTQIAYGVFDYERQIYETLIAKFEAEHPEIQVALVPLDDVTQTQPDASGNYPPDSTASTLRRIVSHVDVAPAFWLNKEGAAAGLALNMKPYMDADTSFDRTDFYPGVLERYGTADTLYTLPRAMNIQALTYNKTLFDTEKIPAPSREWTFADLIAVAEQLAVKENGKITRYGWYDATGGNLLFTYLLDKQGVDILGMQPQDLQPNDPKIIEALRQYKDYVDRGVVLGPMNYGPVGMGARESMPVNPSEYVDPMQLLKDGKIGLWNDSAICCGDQAFSLTYTTGAAVMPAGSYTETMTSSEGYLISSGTRSPQAAWTLVEWLTRQIIPNDARSSNMPGYVYTRKSLNDQFPASAAADSERAEIYAYSIAHLPPLRFTPNAEFTAYYNVLNATWALFEGEPKTPEQAYQQMYQNLQASLNQPNTTPSPTPDARPVVVATPQAQEAGEGQTTITYAAYGQSGSDVRRQLRQLSTVEPGLFVKLIQTDNITGTVTFTDIAERADCFSWSQNLPMTDAELAAVADLQPLIDESGIMDTNDIPPALFDMMRRDGKLFGYPYTYSGRGTVYFPDTFAKLGLDAPKASWTPDEFLKAARALSGNGAYGYSSMGNYLNDINFWVGQFGGQLSTGDGKDLRVTFGSPAAVSAISWFLNLALVEKVMPMPVLYYRTDSNPSQGDPSYELQAQGKLGMWFDSSLGGFDPNNSQADPTQPRVPTAAIAPLPIGKGGIKSADFYVNGLYISANSKNPQACLSLIKYLSDQSATFNNGAIPARVSLARSAAFEQPNSYLAPIRDALIPMLSGTATFNGSPSAFYMFEAYWLNEAMDQILTKKADPTTVLTKAEATTNAYLTCAAGLKPDGSLLECAKQVDPNYKGYLGDQIAVPLAADSKVP